ncbi:HRSL2 protein, partial [Dicaeum eximium]|nr:HRSL2 protein [Dicaeum eximium]
LIEIKRGGYEQWAIYMGDGYVIHLIPVGKAARSLSASSETILLIKTKVAKELLQEVTGNDAWGVNNKYDCHHTPLPLEEIIWRAEACIGRELPYDDFGSTSEDFV